MADKTIPDLTIGALQTGYNMPFAINASTEASKTTIDGLARFIYENYIAAQPAPYYTDSLSVNYGGYGVFGNLFASGKFHSRGTGYFDSIIGGSIASITVGNPTSHVVAGTSSIIQNAPFSAIIGGVGALIKTNTDGGIFAGGGLNNVIESNSSYSSSIGGDTNNVSGNYSSIIGGRLNETNSDYAIILGGSSNTISSSCTRGVLLGGTANSIDAGTEGIVAGGTQCLLSGTQSSIIGGSVNSIGLSSSFNTILGGNSNSIYENCDRNAILGGTTNKVFASNQRGAIIAGLTNTLLSAGASLVVIGGDTNFASGTSNSICSSQTSRTAGSLSDITASTTAALTGINAFILGSVRSIISGDTTTQIRGGIIGGSDNYLSGFHAGIFLGDANKVFASRSATIGGTLITIPSAHQGAYVFADSKVTARTSKCGDSATFHYASGVVVSGSSFEVERTGAFYGGVVMGTGKVVLTAISGSTNSLSTLAIAPGVYSGFAVPAVGVRTGDFVVISQTSYSGSSFGDSANMLLTFNPQAFHNEIRFFMFNPSGPSSIAPNSRLDWLAFKTSPLGAI